jgi:NADH dehydrogenase
MPANENRLTLLTKWLWVIGTRQRASLLITGRPDQHMGVEVGLERLEAAAPEPATEATDPAVRAPGCSA